MAWTLALGVGVVLLGAWVSSAGPECAPVAAPAGARAAPAPSLPTDSELHLFAPGESPAVTF